MRDCNLVRLTGTIFWSKLQDRQTYSVLRLGVKLASGASAFVSVNNPSTKAYDATKAGNKIAITTGFLDTWEKKEGGSEVQIKANDAGVAFFPKEKSLADMNSVAIVGKILSYTGDSAVIEMVGERNPKTNQPSVRKATVKIGDSYKDIVNNKIMLEGQIVSEEIDGKSKLSIQADYNKITIL
jgi:hypothetical protein